MEGETGACVWLVVWGVEPTSVGKERRDSTALVIEGEEEPVVHLRVDSS